MTSSKAASRAPHLRTRLAATSLAVAAAIGLLGCNIASSSGGGSALQPGTGQAAAPAAVAPAGCKDQKVSANLASVEELAAAFKAAGIPSADKWAIEVEEYRPYPDDPNWAKLSKELGKYNIAPTIFNAILSCLDR